MYKRQVLERVIISNETGYSLMPKQYEVADGAVSYTHLDVYKRQIFERGSRIGSVKHGVFHLNDFLSKAKVVHALVMRDRKQPCLLYTSGLNRRTFSEEREQATQARKCK